MNTAVRIISIVLSLTLSGSWVLAAQAQRRAPRRSTRAAGARQQPTRAARAGARQTGLRLTGTYRLDPLASDDPRAVAKRATQDVPSDVQQPALEEVMARLSPPDFISIERRGNNISMASSRAQRISFDATGRENVERAADGHTVRTRASLYGEQLMVSSTGSRDDEYSVNFDSIDGGRRLRVTRRINSDRFSQPVVIQSIYDRTLDVAQWDVYGRRQPARPDYTARDNSPVRTNRLPAQNGSVRNFPPPSPPRIRTVETAPPDDARSDEAFTIPRDLTFRTVLNDNLSTRQSREGDRFTLTVREPAGYEGAIIDGYVAGAAPSGRIAGRSELTLKFERIRLPDGRTAAFDGFIEGVRTTSGEEVRIDTEGGGRVQENTDQTRRTAERLAIGAAVGAIIGAIAGGGKGAAIGAAVGAGAGAGSIYVQGRDDLELSSGTEITIRTTGPR